jgi:hypothetical protein
VADDLLSGPTPRGLSNRVAPVSSLRRCHHLASIFASKSFQNSLRNLILVRALDKVVLFRNLTRSHHSVLNRV